MHRLPCPHCQAPLSVSNTQAGESILCSSCGRPVTVPKLGELRHLPRVDADPVPAESRRSGDLTIGQRIGFGVLGSIALVTLLISGFCWVRWMSVEVPLTTETHIAELRARYAELTAAELVREYEDIEKTGVDLAAPTMYRVSELSKLRWKRNGLVSGTIGIVAVCSAIGLVLMGRHRRTRLGQDT